MERFRLSYSRLLDMTDIDSAGSSIEAPASHAPRFHPAQHGADALSSATATACELQGSASLLPLNIGPPQDLPNCAGGIMASSVESRAEEPMTMRRSEVAQERDDLAQIQVALSVGINASEAVNEAREEAHAGQISPPLVVFERGPGSDHGSADDASVIDPATVEVCASSPTAAGIERGAVLPDRGKRPRIVAAWGRASRDEHAEDQAEVQNESIEEHEETPGDRSGLTDSAYTLRQAVHALSKDSAMALFAPDAVVRADRIKAARGVASPEPDQAPATPAAADGCGKAACGVTSPKPDQAPAGSASTRPTGSDRAANGVAFTESGGLAAAEPNGTASRESLVSAQELPEPLAPSAMTSDDVVDVELGQNMLDRLPGSFLNTISLPGLYPHAVGNAEGGQDPAAGAYQSRSKEAHVQACDLQRSGEADIMVATIAPHAVIGEGEALFDNQAC